jgi:molybdopterin-guanine dinucleotide biosynthesis protein A
LVPSFEVEAFILAGGRSRRFGSEKALARLRGRTLLAHAMRLARTVRLEPRIVCSDPFPLTATGRAFVVGERPGEGPAEGLRAALRACAAPWALVLAVDMPAVDASLIHRLLRAARTAPTESGFVFRDGEQVHPFPGLYAAACRERGRGARSMGALIEAAGVRILDSPETGDRFRNVNRPGDLE